MLSDALDLVGVDDVFHGKRVAYMARTAGVVLGLDAAGLDDLLHAGLFHDCGVSTTREHSVIVAGLDSKDDEAHCLRGEVLVASFQPLAHLASVVRWHHTDAVDLELIDLPDRTRLLANMVFLADRVDVMLFNSPEEDLLLARVPILEMVRQQRGIRFRADIMDAFLAAASNEAFWLTLEPRALGLYIGHLARNLANREMSVTELRQLAFVFATIVDAKSPFTAEHSWRVASVARRLAAAAQLDDERQGLVEVAALLHDIGKLRVPDHILEKPGTLNGPERMRITRHAFDTWQILSRIDGFEEMAQWAAYHHEWVCGGGYPFGISGKGLVREARLVAVADVFQALRQDRPYRGRMSVDTALGIVDSMVSQGKLDADVVSLLHLDIIGCEAAATGTQEPFLGM